MKLTGINLQPGLLNPGYGMPPSAIPGQPQPNVPTPFVPGGQYGEQARGLLSQFPLGAYGQQAFQLAGLLGGQQLPGGQPPPPYTPGPFLQQAYPNGAGGGGPFVPTHRYTTRSK